MKKYIKEKFALTQQGAQDLTHSTMATVMTFLMHIAPMGLLMFLLDQILQQNQIHFGMIAIIAICILIGMYILLWWEYEALYNTTYRESEHLRIQLTRHLSHLPLSYFSQHDLADLAQTIMMDVARIENALSQAIPKNLGFQIAFTILSIMLIIGNPILGFSIVLPIFCYFALIALSRKIQVMDQKKYYTHLHKNAEQFQEAIELQQEIKSFGLDHMVYDELEKQVEMGEKIHMQTEFRGATIANLAALILYLTNILVILFGTSMLVHQQIQLLNFIGYFIASMKLKDIAEGIGLYVLEVYSIDPMAKRIQEIWDTPVQKGKDISWSNYDIELDHVSFSYGKDKQNVLEDITFTAKQGEVCALVGKSGCGKTTLLRLISRLYDYDHGRITISQKDIKHVSVHSLFEKISIVFQDVVLFNTTILENIRLGNVKATDEQVMQAAKLANCHHFIEKLPDGYNTVIGENGVSLSGGERQRLSIARAFLKNAPIIILDEISASLDVDNEKKIQESLNTLIQGKTVLIISHRLKSIENVHKIIVIDQGKVKQQGTHQELLETCEIYRDLIHKSQLAEEFIY